MLALISSAFDALAEVTCRACFASGRVAPRCDLGGIGRLLLTQPGGSLIGHIVEQAGASALDACWRPIDHRAAFHCSYALAWSGHRSLSGAGDVVHRAQIGASQVPPSTFQSQSRSACRPHWLHRARRFRGPQTMAKPPSPKLTRSQTITPPAPQSKLSPPIQSGSASIAARAWIAVSYARTR